MEWNGDGERVYPYNLSRRRRKSSSSSLISEIKREQIVLTRYEYPFIYISLSLSIYLIS